MWTRAIAHSFALCRQQPMVSISTILCVCDLLAAPIYLILVAVVLASVVSPVLRDLSSHGKTRSSVTPTSNNEHPYRGLPGFIHQLCRFVTGNEAFLVKKRLFLHFYIAGIVFTTALRNSGRDGVPRKDIPDLRDVPVVLLLMHLCRRAYECIYVHAWSNGKMHVGGYFLGLLHYAFVPFVLIDSDWCCWKYDALRNQPSSSMIQMAFGALLCCFGQAQQHVHHKILADLRIGSTQPSHGHYSIPTGRWFNYVSCPHYLSEILIYAAFAIMLHPLSADMEPCDTSIFAQRHWHVPIVSVFRLRSYKHLLLFLWVATNLTISAGNSHAWYLRRFGSKYPMHRKAIIPLIL